MFGSTSLFNVRRVEVFRCPQTTTQGANSIAGAIYLVTKDPTFEPEFRGIAQGSDRLRPPSGLTARSPPRC